MIETFSVLSRGHLFRYSKHHGLRYIDGRQVPFRQHLHECRMAKVARVLADLFDATGPFRWDWSIAKIHRRGHKCLTTSGPTCQVSKISLVHHAVDFVTARRALPLGGPIPPVSGGAAEMLGYHSSEFVSFGCWFVTGLQSSSRTTCLVTLLLLHV
jgi:hypothetical protein